MSIGRFRAGGGRASSAPLARAAALLALIGLCFAEAGTFAHQALVEHTVCAEHGETVHAAEAAASPAVAPRPTAAISGRAAADASENHHHCSALPQSRQNSAVSQPTIAVAPIELTLACAPPRSASVARVQSRLYLSAPKTSPPA